MVAATGDAIYPVMIQFLLQHKSPPKGSLWAPHFPSRSPADNADRRKAIVDVGVIYFTRPGCDPVFRLRLGVVLKRGLDVMRTLPPPATIISNPSIERAFHAFSFQARVLDICLSEFQVYHFGCTFCFIRAHLLLTEYD